MKAIIAIMTVAAVVTIVLMTVRPSLCMAGQCSSTPYPFDRDPSNKRQESLVQRWRESGTKMCGPVSTPVPLTVA